MAIVIRTSVLVLVCIGFLPLLALEPTPVLPAPPGYVALKTVIPPKIDGKLDDECWKAVPWSADFVDIEGDKKPKPRYRTRMKMLWDEKALYIAAELEEPHVWGTITQHDAVIFQDPDFEVFINPDGNNHLYAELELNAKNTTWDLLLTKPYKDGGKALNGWEIIGLKTAVHVNGTINNAKDVDQSWTVEIMWPWEGFKELSNVAVPPKDGDQWRVNFSRVEWDTTIEAGQYVKVKGKPEHNWVWAPTGIIDIHRPEKWGTLQFSTKTNGKVDYKPDPMHGVKDYMHEVYYAQREYHKKHGQYTRNLADLGLKAHTLGTPDIELTPRGFEASLTVPDRAGRKRWGITHDALLWNK